MVGKLTIVIPCFESEAMVHRCVIANLDVLQRYRVIILNKTGGERFRDFIWPMLFNMGASFWFSRRFGYEFVRTEYILNLDVDTILPDGYVEKAIQIMDSDLSIGAVALDYAAPFMQSHLAFGTSIWRTVELRALYDWRMTSGQSEDLCECRYMFKKVEAMGKRVVSIDGMSAVHMKGES